MRLGELKSSGLPSGKGKGEECLLTKSDWGNWEASRKINERGKAEQGEEKKEE